MTFKFKLSVRLALMKDAMALTLTGALCACGKSASIAGPGPVVSCVVISPSNLTVSPPSMTAGLAASVDTGNVPVTWRATDPMNWDKVREWIQTLGLVSIPFILGLAGNAVAKSNATREVNAKMVEVAVQVLSAPVNDSIRPLRLWATNVLKRYSEVPFSAPAESSLTNYRIMLVPIPFAGPTQIVQLRVSPKSITILPRQSATFTADGIEPGGDRALVDVTWSATGGSITAEGRSYARYTAPSVPGDYAVIASSSGLADTALVHVQRP